MCTFLKKMGIVVALTALLVFLVPISGIASAKSLTTTRTQSCGWQQISDGSWTEYTNPNGPDLGIIEFLLWANTCTGGYHCQAYSPSSNGYSGALFVSIYSGSSVIETIYGGVSPDASINTNTYFISNPSCWGGTN